MNLENGGTKHLTPALSPSAALSPAADAERETLLPRLGNVMRWVVHGFNARMIFMSLLTRHSSHF